MVAVLICVTSFVGVEDAANYGEEARRGSIGRAMVSGVVVAAIVYALSAWAMSVATVCVRTRRDGVLPAVLGVAPHRRTGQRGDRWQRPGAGRDRHRGAGAVVSVLGLGLVVALTLTQYATLLGVPAGGPVTWRLPSLLAAAFALGVPRAGYLRARQRRGAPPLLAAGTDLTGR